MSESYKDLLRQYRRRLIIELLNESNDLRINEIILKSMINTRLSAVGSDVLRSDLQWLEDQSLIRIEKHADLWVAELTKTGQDVATGAMVMPGIPKKGAV